MQTIVVIVVVSSSLLIGALWGIYRTLPENVEGFLVALAGGALIVSAVLELVEPAIRQSAFWAPFVLLGSLTFVAFDYFVDEKWGSDSGWGMLTAITLDGIPENLALGVALIGVGPLQVAALSGSIILSNLPEAAAGAEEMTDGGRSRAMVLALWGATALLLSATSLLGNFALAGLPEHTLALIRSFAGGAVVASLATEIFPKAFKKDSHTAGIATAIGLIVALYLNTLA